MESNRQSIETERADAALRVLAESETLLATLRAGLTEFQSERAAVFNAGEIANAKSAEITAAATAALAASAKITDDQTVIAQKSAHIQDAQEHADRVRAELDRLQTLSIQYANEAESHRNRAQTATDSATELLSEIRGHKTSAEADETSIDTLLNQCKAAFSTLKVLAEKADMVEQRIAHYEARLAEIENQSVSQLETITRLLPGATAAGLAHAFDDRRQTFLKPAVRWQWVFVGSVVCLAILALTGLINVYHTDPTLGWDTLGRSWLARLPIAAALIWLALHSSRESALAKRLEEDYGYKAAVAASFQGFQKQMADIGASVPDGAPLTTLCANTLSTISSPPGRIYEKHRLTITPAGELVEAATGEKRT